MNSPLKYLQLWQAKRNELQITEDPQADWMQMQQLLDVHMPVNPPTGNGKPSVISNFRWWLALAIGVTAAVLLYLLLHNSNIKAHKADNNIPTETNKRTPGTSSVSQQHGNNTAAGTTPGLSKNDKSAPGAIVLQGKAATPSTGGVRNSAPSAPVPAKVSGNPPAQVAPNTSVRAVNNKSVLSANSGRRSRLAITPGAGSSAHGRGGYSTSGHSRGGAAGNQTGHRTPPNQRNDMGIHGQDSVGNTNKQNQSTEIANRGNANDLIVLHPLTNPLFNFNAARWPAINANAALIKMPVRSPVGPSKNSKNAKKTKGKNPAPTHIDWGVSAIVNSPGSFTPKARNANFYGSAPLDVYAGLFANWQFSKKLAVNLQLKGLSPQVLSGSYTHKNPSKIDSLALLQISDSRKVYSVNIPLHIVYRPTKNISLKAGPVLSIPVKQASSSSGFQPAAVKKDSINYPKIATALNKTSYNQKANFGFSGGVNFQYKRLILGADYQKNFSPFKVSSSLGSYNFNKGIFQFSVGFQLSKLKP